MRIRVKTDQKVKVLTLKASDWRMDNGRSGTSYKAGILSDGDIDKSDSGTVPRTERRS